MKTVSISAVLALLLAISSLSTKTVANAATNTSNTGNATSAGNLNTAPSVGSNNAGNLRTTRSASDGVPTTNVDGSTPNNINSSATSNPADNNTANGTGNAGYLAKQPFGTPAMPPANNAPNHTTGVTSNTFGSTSAVGSTETPVATATTKKQLNNQTGQNNSVAPR